MSLDVIDRKAFRLCIDAEDCDSLLNADIWPDSVVIAECFPNHGCRVKMKSRRKEDASW